MPIYAGVYPRVGGGTADTVKWDRDVKGLSPRGRGNRVLGQVKEKPNRSIPAWAGEPNRVMGKLDIRSVYPRVGGGTASSERRHDALCGLSPRGRGNHRIGGCDEPGPGSIPAWAGEPRGGLEG